MSDGHDRFQCPSCHKRFRWKSDIAGRKVRCTACDLKMRIPAAAGDTAHALDPLPAPAAAPADDGYDLSLDDLLPSQTPAAQTAAGKCPSCNTSVKPGAVICINCGFNLQSGTRLNTAVAKGPAAPAGRGATIAVDGPDELTRAGLIGMKITGVGLLLHFVGFLGAIASGGGLAAAFFIDDVAILVLPAIIGLLVSAGLILLGPILCLAAPAAAGRNTVIAALGLYILAGGVYAYAYHLQSQGNGELLVLIVQIAGNIANLSATACFLYFYQQMANFLESSPLSETARSLLTLFGWIIVGQLLLFVPLLGCFVAIGLIGLQVVLSIWYVILTGQLAGKCLRYDAEIA